jgi:hypothetical protein
MTESPRKIELDAAKNDPSRYFDRPDDVVRDPRLTTAQKIEILRQWETDARLMSVAEEENMPGTQVPPLDSILKAIKLLQGPAETGERRSGARSSKLGV